MIRRAFAFAALATGWIALSAHVGSPTVFFEGSAGAYPVRVVIRPPEAIPGLADIAVRVPANGVSNVTVQPVRWDLGLEGAPRADNALQSPGEAELWTAQLWFMEFGSYSVHVTIEGDQGTGSTVVPVPALATNIAEMSLGLQMALIGLALFLFVGMLSIVGAAAREASLPPGDQVEPDRKRRSRRVQLVAAPLIGLALFGGARWWEAEDNVYQNNLYVPLAIEAREDGAQIAIDIVDERWTPERFTPLIPDHGKLMHMFLIRADGQPGFAHLHPQQVDSSRFFSPLPALPPGEYWLFADILHQSGFPQTLTDTLALSGASTAAMNADPDDSWLSSGSFTPATGSATLSDGSTMHWTGEPALQAGRETTLSFQVIDPDGASAQLEPYMGMAAHAAITRDDGSVFVHLHPQGTISMTSQQLFVDRAESGELRPAMPGRMMNMAVIEGSTVSFPFEFPQPGPYRVWVQVKRAGQVLTGAFAVEVAE